MKNLLSFILHLFPLFVSGQNLTANYSIEKTISISQSPTGPRIMTIDLIGHLYQKGNQFIYWEEPVYLKKFPNGTIDMISGNNSYSYVLNKDSIQNVVYTNYDNHILRMAALGPGDTAQEFEMDEDYGPGWEYKSDTKVIDGLKCQLATDRDQWLVWFCPDIPAKSGMFNVKDLPGLVVEADWIPNKTHYKLLSYDTQKNVGDDVFMPKPLQGTIVKSGRLKSYKRNKKEKTKEEKRIDLLNRNN